jgi:hypothetical protein
MPRYRPRRPVVRAYDRWATFWARSVPVFVPNLRGSPPPLQCDFNAVLYVGRNIAVPDDLRPYLTAHSSWQTDWRDP